MKKENTSNYLDYFLFSVYIIFLVSVVFSFRAVSSICIGVLLITGIATKRKSLIHLPHKKDCLLFLLGCSLFFVLQCISLLYTRNIIEGVKLLQISSGIIFIPFAVFCTSSFLTPERFDKLISYFIMIVCFGSLYCLAVAVFKYSSGAPIYTFFYHDLVAPLSQHAIRFSIMVFIALLFLFKNLEERDKYFPELLSHAIIVFLSLFLILLSSKLIISFYVLFLVRFFFYKQIYKRKFLALTCVAALMIIMLTPNPISNRFRLIFAGNSLLFEEQKFNPDIYFNGVQFRLLEWRFTYEILTEQKAWGSGLTPGDAQSYLDKKYIGTNMHIGKPGVQNDGYLGYHTHNQFLQSLLESGLLSLMIFLFICYSLFKLANASKKNELKWFTALLLIYCFTDAPFETQYGIVIFTFFPLFLYFESQTLMKPTRSFCQFRHLNLTEVASPKQPN